MTLSVDGAITWLTKLNEQIQANKEYLTDLDQKIGDGDHGINLSRGFKEVIDKVSTTTYTTLGTLFKDVGMTLIAKVGGASGPLYGTIFLKMSLTFKEQVELDQNQLIEGLRAALDGVKMRGKANVGDKTMVDVWEPVITYMEENPSVTMQQIERVAKEKMEATKDTEAKKGRAAYLGKRSVGHIDPGAASSYLFFASLVDAFRTGESLHE